MVKVIIVNNGRKKVLNGELVAGFIMSSNGDTDFVRGFVSGSGNDQGIVLALADTIPFMLKHDDRLDYLANMAHLHELLGEKIKEELKGNADEIADILKNL